MELLEVRNVSKTYGTGEATVHALKNAAGTSASSSRVLT